MEQNQAGKVRLGAGSRCYWLNHWVGTADLSLGPEEGRAAWRREGADGFLSPRWHKGHESNCGRGSVETKGDRRKKPQEKEPSGTLCDNGLSLFL